MNHVVKDHTFKNGYLFYRFTIHDKDHGHVPDVSTNITQECLMVSSSGRSQISECDIGRSGRCAERSHRFPSQDERDP